MQGLPVPAGVNGAHYISPRMRARMDDMGLREADISAVVGTGAGGRVTVEDLEKFLDYIETWPSAAPRRCDWPWRMRCGGAGPGRWPPSGGRSGSTGFWTIGASRSPKPGLTLYVLRAFALALEEQPMSAGFLIGEKVVHPRAFDIGVAVQVEDGVVVPVLRNVDENPSTELVNEYDDWSIVRDGGA